MLNLKNQLQGVSQSKPDTTNTGREVDLTGREEVERDPGVVSPCPSKGGT